MTRLNIHSPKQTTPQKQHLNNDGSITDHSTTKKSRFIHWPLWDLAFRPWFLLASFFSILSLGAWLLFLNDLHPTLSQHSLGPTLWHIHEMIFGFAAIIAIAFVLTAVQTWTGLRSLNGVWLVALTGLSLCIRGQLWFELYTAPWQLILTQGTWWLICIGVLNYLIIKNLSQHNYIFISI